MSLRSRLKALAASSAHIFADFLRHIGSSVIYFRSALSQFRASLEKISQGVIERLAWLDKHKHILRIVVVALALAASALIYYLRLSHKTTYYVAYIGRYQTQGLDELQEMLLREYINTLNMRAPDIRFELRPFKIKKTDNTYDSRDAYQTISNDPQTVVVLDNTWGKNLASVRDLITNHDIPVISMNADTQNKDYKNQVVFIGYDDHVPEEIAIFAKKILLDDQTRVIVAEDESIFPSSAALKNAFPGIEPLLVHSDSFKAEENATLDAAIQQLNCSTSNERRALIVNTHWSWGEEIIKRVNSECQNVDILGGPYIVSQQKIRSQPDEETGSKSDDIILKNDNRLILFTRSRDAVSSRVHNEAANVKKLLPQSNPELFIERCIHAITIIEQVISDGHAKSKKQAISKIFFSAAFRKMVNHTFIRDNDDIYSEAYSFDNKLRLDDNRIFQQYYNGEISSYPQQLNSEKKPVPDIRVGVEDIEISSIDTKNSSFHAHFTYWWKCNDPTIDPNKYLFFRNQTKIDLVGNGNQSLPLNEHQGIEGKYQLFKISGDFEMQADLTRYPLDQQELTIELAAIYPRESVRISFDDESSKRLDKKVRVSSNEWDKEDSFFTVDNILGETDRDISSAARKQKIFETLNIRTKINRNPKYSYITIIIPLLMIGLVAIGVLFVRDGSFESIGHVCVVIFLAIATYRITFAELIPNAGHLTVADKLLFGAFVTIFLVFTKVIILNSGVGSRHIQEWIKARTLIIGYMGLATYCLMAIFALVM